MLLLSEIWNEFSNFEQFFFGVVLIFGFLFLLICLKIRKPGGKVDKSRLEFEESVLRMLVEWKDILSDHIASSVLLKMSVSKLKEKRRKDRAEFSALKDRVVLLEKALSVLQKGLAGGFTYPEFEEMQRRAAEADHISRRLSGFNGGVSGLRAEGVPVFRVFLPGCNLPDEGLFAVLSQNLCKFRKKHSEVSFKKELSYDELFALFLENLRAFKEKPLGDAEG